MIDLGGANRYKLAMRLLTLPAIATAAAILPATISYAGVTTANKLNTTATTSQAAPKSGAVPPDFRPPGGSVAATRPLGRPQGERYWFTPDYLRIYKVRGEGGGRDGQRIGAEGTKRNPLPILSWNLKTWPESGNAGYPEFTSEGATGRPGLQSHRRRGGMAGTAMGIFASGAWSNVPEVEGWGTEVPYLGLSGVARNEMERDRLVQDLGVGNKLSGTRTDKPFDGGFTRYELWVGKARSTTAAAQGGGVGGWGQVAWFFDGYNIVNQAGEALGTLRTITSDSENPKSRAFRNSPYIVESTEAPKINRTFAVTQQGGGTQLRELPKMLVLLAPGAQTRKDYERLSGQTGSAATGARRVGARAYLRDEGLLAGGGLVMQPDQGNFLAPNGSVDELNDRISQFWTQANDRRWVFRKWQRAENLFKNGSGAGAGAAWHRWVLETKSDILYAPSDKGGRGNAITVANSEDLEPVPDMVIATADVQGFDTGGFRVGLGGNMQPDIVFNDPDDIADSDIVTVLPVGRFYPRSAVYVAVQYLLLDENGNPEGSWANAKTAALFYWRSDENRRGVRMAGDLARQSITAGDPSLTPRIISFGDNTGSAGFDPYKDAWVISVRDLAHTSAVYRLRIFMSIPFSPLNGGSITPTQVGAGFPGTITSLANIFTADNMAGVLRANHLNPITYAAAEAVDDAISFQHPDYKNILRGANLAGAGGKWKAPQRVVPVNQDVVEWIVANTKGLAVAAGSPTDPQSIHNPWASSGPSFAAQWFEFGDPGSTISWRVEVPDIRIGVDEGEAGVIITE